MIVSPGNGILAKVLHKRGKRETGYDPFYAPIRNAADYAQSPISLCLFVG